MHRIIRGELAIAGDDAREMSVLFKQGYRGSRFSFGDPACPNLEDQAQLLSLITEAGIPHRSRLGRARAPSATRRARRTRELANLSP